MIRATDLRHRRRPERRSLRRLATAVLSTSLVASVLTTLTPLSFGGAGTASAHGTEPVAGPVILDGTDSGLHGSVGTSGPVSASQLNSTWVYELKAWETLLATVPASYANNGKVALVGAEDSTWTSNDCGAAAHHIALRVNGGPITVDYFDGATAIGGLFDDVLAGTADYAMIQIVEEDWCANGMDSSEAAVVNARGPAIAAHVNRGGALFAQSQSYGWLSSLFPTLTASTMCGDYTPELTDAGFAQFPGLTNANIAAPWHNCFLDSSGTFPLTQLAMQSGTDTVILGGTSVPLPSNITVTTNNPQPRPNEEVCTTSVVTSDGDPVVGASVRFSVDGVFAEDAVTGGTGIASYCYVKAGTGSDVVTATVLSGPGIGSTSATVGWSNIALVATPGTNLARGNTACVDATAGVYSGGVMTPSAGTSVSFVVDGANAPTPATLVTDASGVAQYCYTSSEGGVDEVTATIGTGGSADSRTIDITWTGPRITVPALAQPAGQTGKVVPMTVAEFTGSTDVWAHLSLPTGGGSLSVNTTGLTLTRTVGSSFSDQQIIEFTGTLSAVTSALASRVTWNAPAAGQAQTLSVSVRNHAVESSATMVAGASTVLSSTVVPAIATAPTNVSVVTGTDALFTSTATGYPAPTVVWQVSTDGGSTFADVPGATSTTLSVPTTMSLDGNQYSAKFSNTVGFVTSVAATLTVTVPVTVPQVITVDTLADTPLDQTAPTVAATVDSGLPLTIVAGPANVCTNLGTVLTLIGEGTCTVTVSHPGDATHDPASVARSFTVAAPVAAPQTVTLPVIADTPLDRSPITLPSVSDAGLPVTYTAGPASVCSVEGVILTLVGEGTCTVTATQVGDATHQPATASRSFVVTPRTLVLDLVLTAGRSVGGAPVVVQGHGLKPLSPVRIELHSTPILLATVMTDADGAFTTTVNLPAEVAAGSHTVRAIGEDPEGGIVTAEEALFIDWSGSLGTPPTRTGYTPISPVRLLDTREGARLAAGATYELAIPANLVPSDVTAVAVNVSVTESEQAGFLTVYPCSSERPLASALNHRAGETRSNLVVPALTAGTKLCIYTMSATHVVADLNGYHQSSADAQLVAATPVRLVDSRATTSLAAGETVEVQVVGDGRAAAGSTAAALYVAVDGAQAAGFLTVFPCGTARPLAANLNYAAGETIGNDVVAKIGDGGKVCIYTMSATDLVVDLDGWFRAGSGGGSFRALVPGRFVDTRRSTIVEAGQVLQLAMIGESALPSGTTAVSLDVAVDRPRGAGFLTVFPCGAARPLAANLNFGRGDTVAGHVTAQVGSNGGVCVYSSATTHIVVDVEGAYAPVG